MPSHPRRTVAALTVLVAAVALASVLALPGCGGSSNKSTNPPSGGGALVLDSPNLGQGAVYEKTFATTGTFAYHCKIHSFMTAVVIVDDGTAAGDKVVDITGSAFSPASISVHSGNKVTWTNRDAITHTVTSS